MMKLIFPVFVSFFLLNFIILQEQSTDMKGHEMNGTTMHDEKDTENK